MPLPEILTVDVTIEAKVTRGRSESVLQDLPDEVQETASVSLSLCELAEGMVIAKDIVTNDDARLVRNGQRISQATLEKLQMYANKNTLPAEFFIYESSCVGKTPAAAMV